MVDAPSYLDQQFFSSVDPERSSDLESYLQLLLHQESFTKTIKFPQTTLPSRYRKNQKFFARYIGRFVRNYREVRAVAFVNDVAAVGWICRGLSHDFILSLRVYVFGVV